MNPKTWMCVICGWLYDEAEGAPSHGIAPGTSWEQVPADWCCPECGAHKLDFEMVQI
ncbi:MAG TPA: rubredoxin [Ottowia sp.]|nr:rubredoxin [Ottowia sp.]HOM19443.1 rubredoxin [Ottowia sp.]HPP97559.1 rubredoxin [Ottowia sp.]HQZ57090.1 rubredoxin [Ottowia sp.]HRB10851.1 rubredoxin [Ottowia sp.]